MKTETLLLLLGGGAALYLYFQNQQQTVIAPTAAMPLTATPQYPMPPASPQPPAPASPAPLPDPATVDSHPNYVLSRVRQYSGALPSVPVVSQRQTGRTGTPGALAGAFPLYGGWK